MAHKMYRLIARLYDLLDLPFERGRYALIRPVLRELARIVRPGGEIRILEYQYSARPLRRFVMHLWAPWVRFAYGATFDRDTAQYLREAGLEPVEERFLFQDNIKLIVARTRG